MIKKIKSKLLKDIHLFEILKGASINLIFQVFGIFVSYLFLWMISRNYGAEGMGVFSLAFTLLNIFVLFRDFFLYIKDS